MSAVDLPQANTVLYRGRNVVVASRGDTTEVRRAGRRVWSRYTPTLGVASVARDPRSGRFLVSVRGVGIAFFAPSGALVRSVDYPAYRDPRPLLPLGKTVVYGVGVYNWTPWKPGRDAYAQMLWHDAVRRYHARDVATGRELWSSRSMAVGLPCGRRGDRLLCLNLADWTGVFRHGLAPHFLLQERRLQTGVLLRSVPLRAPSADRLLMAVTGWEATGVRARRIGGRLAIVESGQVLARAGAAR